MSALEQRLKDAIASGGPITFARFMEEALYDPAEGFYATPPIGRDAHYVTSPHVSSAFAELLCTQIARCRDEIGEPFVVVEAGAGDGTLASQIVALLGVPYIAVDRSAGARRALQVRGIDARASLGDGGPFRGVLLANELLDNVPFHRIRRHDAGLVEVFVDVRDGRFVETEGDVSPEAAPLVDAEHVHDERAVSPGWIAFVRDAARVLEHGLAIVIDIGVDDTGAGSVRGYHSQRVTDDVLVEPGSRDITGPVDFGALAAEAKRLGLDVWGPVTQRDMLLGLGLRRWLDGLRDRQVEATAAGDSRTAVRLFSERSRAPMLADRDQLGALKVLAFGRGVAPPAFVNV